MEIVDVAMDLESDISETLEVVRIAGRVDQRGWHRCT